jgi:nicotinamide-nucleotide amidase
MAVDALLKLAAEVGAAMKQRGWMLALAESCTGGGAAEAVTAVPGSSGWFERGFVTYSNQSKIEMLGVRPQTLETHGAVSEAVVLEMARGAIVQSRAQVAVAISGIAGPDGGTPDKPVGTVWFAWHLSSGQEISRLCRFHGDRQAIRRQAVEHALQGLIELTLHADL